MCAREHTWGMFSMVCSTCACSQYSNTNTGLPACVVSPKQQGPALLASQLTYQQAVCKCSAPPG